MDKPVCVIGAGGHSGVVIEALQCQGVDIIGIFDINPALHGSKISGITVVGGDEAVFDYDPAEISLVNGIGSVTRPDKRERVFRRLKEKGYSFRTVVHPTASIAAGVVCEEGTQILAGAVIQGGTRIGANCLINIGALIAHDCEIDSHVHVGPGVGLAGGVRIGEISHLGIGAVVLQRVCVARCAVIGAGAVVLTDVPEGATVVGVPARVLLPSSPRRRDFSDSV